MDGEEVIDDTFREYLVGFRVGKGSYDTKIARRRYNPIKFRICNASI